ncbi:hypothetical protein L2E82_25367 [Cichorium intybus]|uniref:Uncharacterized protein n=1 Tax=Cichorium intybus TaxID=13427 RepID=A0ACB9E3D6_CICIN|nr:hypothetical protein L2E82_25367 [Cichorium intybus]
MSPDHFLFLRSFIYNYTHVSTAITKSHEGCFGDSINTGNSKGEYHPPTKSSPHLRILDLSPQTPCSLSQIPLHKNL